MKSFLEFYQRNYFRILGGIVALAVAAGLFFLGYAKGSPRSISQILGDLRSRATSVITGAWEQTASTEPAAFLQPSRGEGEGVTVNELQDLNDLILIAGFFDNNPGLQLLLRDGTVVAHWPVRVTELLPERSALPGFPKTDWNADIHGAWIEPDGSVLFNIEYQGTVKLTRCGERVWALPEGTHHTLSPASAGGYWIGGRRISDISNDPNYRPVVTANRTTGRIEDDLVLRVDDDGKIVQSKSVYELLLENGLEALMTGIGTDIGKDTLSDDELLHLNKITELTPDLAPAFPDFAAGDLVLSIRDFNLVLVVEPGTWKVKWHHTGPWLRQHNARFMIDGTISVFDNNIYASSLLPGRKLDLSVPHEANIVAMDPKTRETRVLYGLKPGQEMLSVFRGYHQEMPGGGLLITEPEAGRAFQVDASGRKVWEFISRWDDDRVLEITSADAFPADYFTVTDWSCP